MWSQSPGLSREYTTDWSDHPLNELYLLQLIVTGARVGPLVGECMEVGVTARHRVLGVTLGLQEKMMGEDDRGK